MKGTTAIAVVIKDLVSRLPHIELDDGVSPMDYRENYYGNFPFTTLNRKEFKERRGKLCSLRSLLILYPLYIFL